MRAYAVSVMAFSQLHEKAPAGGTYVEHLPVFIAAEDIDEAADQAEAFALERWPISETWYGHNAAIEPVTEKFFERCFGEIPADIDVDPDERGQIFTYDG